MTLLISDNTPIGHVMIFNKTLKETIEIAISTPKVMHTNIATFTVVSFKLYHKLCGKKLSKTNRPETSITSVALT